MTDPIEVIRRAVLSWPQHRDEETVKALDALIADAARFRKFCAITAAFHFVGLYKVGSGTYFVAHATSDGVVNSADRSTLEQLIDDLPEPPK